MYSSNCEDDNVCRGGVYVGGGEGGVQVREQRQGSVSGVLELAKRGASRDTRSCCYHCRSHFCPFRGWIMGCSQCPTGGGRLKVRDWSWLADELINSWSVKVTTAVLSGYG